MTSERNPNRLIYEKSPYLLQHAYRTKWDIIWIYTKASISQDFRCISIDK